MRRTQIILVVAAVLAVVLYFMYWPTAARIRSHALQLSEAGQHEKAIKELRRLIEEYPRHRIAAKAKKDISEIEAEKLFQEALACVGSSPSYYSAKLCLLPLQQHYPGSAAATKADERLAELYSEEANSTTIPRQQQNSKGGMMMLGMHSRRRVKSFQMLSTAPRPAMPLLPSR